MTNLTQKELRAKELREINKMWRDLNAPLNWTADGGQRVFCAGAEWRYESVTGWFLREGERIPPGSSRVPTAVKKHFES